MSISDHKNRLVSSHQSVGRIGFRWQNPLAESDCTCNSRIKKVEYCSFKLLCSKNILTNLVGLLTANLSLCQDGIRGWNQLLTENGVSFYMCSAVEVAWLAQNIRHSSTRM